MSPVISPSDAPLPRTSFSRILRAVSGEQPWTDDERLVRQRSPRILFAEAQARAEYAFVQAERRARIYEFKQALRVCTELPTAEMQQTAREYLVTIVPPEFLEELRPLVRRRLPGRQLAVAIVVAAAAILLIVTGVFQLLPMSEEQKLERTIIAKSEVLENGTEIRGNKTRGTGNIYSDDTFTYSAQVTTPFQRTWLLNMYGNERDIFVGNGVKTEGAFHLEHSLRPEARDCLEYFIVIAADGAAISDSDTQREWLFELQDELLRIQSAADPECKTAAATALRHLKKSGYSAAVKIHVDRYIRHKEPRT